MRHPLYLANFVIFFGFLLVTGNLWIVLAGSLVFYMYYERIALAEEEFLLERFGARYLAWANVTPLLPRLRSWRAPELPFCWRSAVRREYRTLCSTLLAFALLDEVEDAVTHGRIGLEPPLVLLVAFAGLAFLLIRLARQHTRWLHAPER